MNKTIKYAGYSALFCGILKGLHNIIEQKSRPNYDGQIDFKEVLLKTGKGVLFGAAVGGITGAIKDSIMTDDLNNIGGTENLLNRTLEFHKPDNYLLSDKAKTISKLIEEEFGDNLSCKPYMSGSHVKGTSILNSDIDIHVKFSKKAGTLNVIRENIHSLFQEKIMDDEIESVRIQNWSIGIFLKINADVKRIDIVPMRDIENNKGDAFIISNNNGSIKKINYSAHRQVFSFTDKQKKLIKLLKIWKEENQIDIPSIYLELMAKKAFEKIQFPRGLRNSLLRLIEYLADNIVSTKLIDPANSNNIISNVISDNKKISIQEKCYKMLNNIEKDERNFLDYFPNFIA